MKNPILSISQIEPNPKDTCLCGSGKMFKKCCRNTYNTNIKDHDYKNFNDGKYDEALISCRSHITWYILCHRAHTVPFISSGDPRSDSLLKIDIDSMDALVGLLHHCYYKTNKSKQFPKTLGILSNAISDSRWINIITREMAFWHLIDNNDANQAFKELQKIDIKTCTDMETLVLYLDVCPYPIPFRDRLNIIDRILAITRKESYILQYTCFKGISYCLIGEIEDGCNMVEGAITRYTNCAAEKKTDYGDYFLPNAIAILGMFKNDSKRISDAIEIYINQLDSKSLTDSDISMLTYKIAKCYSWLEKYDEAIRYYKMSLDKESSDLTKVFLSRSLINSGDIKEGRKLLTSIQTDEFNDASNYDLSVSWAILAFNSKERDDIERAKTIMKEAKGQYSFFEQQKKEILIDLNELKPTSGGNFIKKALKSLNHYILLRPNLFGCGINVNKIIEDMEPKMPTNSGDTNESSK